MATKSSVETFDLWKKAHTVTVEVFKSSRSVAPDLQRGFVAEWRTAAIDVCVSIARAYACRVPKDRVLDYETTANQLERLKYLTTLARDLDVIEATDPLFKRLDEIGRIVHANIVRFSKEFR